MFANLYVSFSLNVFILYCFHLFLYLLLFFKIVKNNKYYIYLLFGFSLLLTFYVISPIDKDALVNNEYGLMRYFRLIFLFALFLISMFGLIRRRRFNFGFGLHLYLIFSLFAIFSSIYSVNMTVSAYKSAELFVDILFVYFLSSNIESVEDCKSFLDVLYVSFVFLCLTSLINILIYPEQSLPWVRSDIFPFRLRGAVPIINSNELSQMATVAAVISLNRLLSPLKTNKFFICIFFALMIFTLIISCSRTSLFAFVLMSVYILIYWKKYLYIFFLAPVIFSLTYIYGSEIIISYFLRGESLETITKIGGRMAIWPLFFELFLESPILGRGFYSAFRFIDPSIASKYMISTSTINTTDNTYIEILLGIGLIGITITLLFLFVSFFYTIKIKTNSLMNLSSLIKPELFSIFSIIVIRSFTGPTFSQHTFNSLTLAMIMAISYLMFINKS